MIIVYLKEKVNITYDAKMRYEITKKLIIKGLDNDLISFSTSLTIEKIQELRNEMDN